MAVLTPGDHSILLWIILMLPASRSSTLIRFTSYPVLEHFLFSLQGLQMLRGHSENSMMIIFMLNRGIVMPFPRVSTWPFIRKECAPCSSTGIMCSFLHLIFQSNLGGLFWGEGVHTQHFSDITSGSLLMNHSWR